MFEHFFPPKLTSGTAHYLHTADHHRGFMRILIEYSEEQNQNGWFLEERLLTKFPSFTRWGIYQRVECKKILFVTEVYNQATSYRYKRFIELFP